MEFYIAIIFLILLGLPILFFSFKQLDWILNKQKHINMLMSSIKKELNTKDKRLIFLQKMSDEEVRKYANIKKPKILVPGFFGPSEKYTFWKINYVTNEGYEKKGIVKTKQSIFFKDEINIIE